MTDTSAVSARRSRAAGRGGVAVGLAVRAARSAPALPLETIAESARTTSERLLTKLRTLSGRGPCAEVAAATAAANGAPGPLAVALRHRVCPPSTGRVAIKGRSKTAAAAAVGTPGWAARRKTGATVPRVLWTRAATSDRSARRGVASDPACPAVMLTRLAADHAAEVRVAASRNPHCPQLLVAALATDPDIKVAQSAGQHPSLPKALLDVFADGNDWQRVAAAANPISAGDTLQRLAGDNDSTVRYAVAINPSCPPRSLAELTTNEYPEIRAAAARNHSCNPDTLQRLTQDKDKSVRSAAAANPSCSSQTLHSFAEDPDEAVRAAVVSNPSLASDLFARLAKDRNDVVRVAVAAAGHEPQSVPNRSRDVVDKISKSVDSSLRSSDTVSETLAASLRTDRRTLQQLSRRDNVQVRVRVAANPNTPPSTLMRLSTDSEPPVCHSAVRTLAGLRWRTDPSQRLGP